MPYFKDPQNNLHWLDSADHASLLPKGSVEITDSAAQAILPPSADTPGNKIKQQIAELEASVTPRRIREAMRNPSAQAWINAVDDQIIALRAKLV